MNWYVIDKEYVEYLHGFDDKVEHISYGERLKPYIGILLHINNFSYYVPVSSAKPKHDKIKEDIDIFKIKEKSRKILGVLNINNMVPVLDEYVIKLDYEKIDMYRKFFDKKEELKYVKFLAKELEIVNNNINIIREKAERTYRIKSDFPNARISSRCCDFKLLEEKASNYRLIC